MAKFYYFCTPAQEDAGIVLNKLGIVWVGEVLMLNMFTDKKTLKGAYNVFKKCAEKAVADGVIPQADFEPYDEECSFGDCSMLNYEEDGDYYYIWINTPYGYKLENGRTL